MIIYIRNGPGSAKKRHHWLGVETQTKTEQPATQEKKGHRHKEAEQRWAKTTHEIVADTYSTTYSKFFCPHLSRYIRLTVALLPPSIDGTVFFCV